MGPTFMGDLKMHELWSLRKLNLNPRSSSKELMLPNMSLLSAGITWATVELALAHASMGWHQPREDLSQRIILVCTTAAASEPLAHEFLEVLTHFLKPQPLLP